MSQYLTTPHAPKCEKRKGNAVAAKRAHAAHERYTLGRCLVVNLETSKCQISQWATDAHSLRGDPRNVLVMVPERLEVGG